jgi:hypothetical protein
MKEILINEIHLVATGITVVIYSILCLTSKYVESSKMEPQDRNIAFARIIFGFLSALFLLSLEFRYVTVVFKDNVLLRSFELIVCLILIGLYLYANENKLVAGDQYDRIFKVLNPLIIAFSIMASGSLNNLLNHYKDAIKPM